MPGTGSPGTRSRRPGYRGEALLALLPSLGVMLLVAGGAADRGVLYPLVLLSGSALGLGALLAIFPRGPQFLLGVANGLAMYACLFTVIGRVAFPAAPELTQALGFLLPVAVFVGACWWRRAGLARYARDGAADLNHLPRFARWLAVIGVVGVVSLSLPINRLSPPWQGVGLLLAMAIIAVLTPNPMTPQKRKSTAAVSMPGWRRSHLRPRSNKDGRRARIGRSSRNRRRSAANSPALW